MSAEIAAEVRQDGKSRTFAGGNEGDVRKTAAGQFCQ
jgi:hypothetical protein